LRRAIDFGNMEDLSVLFISDIWYCLRHGFDPGGEVGFSLCVCRMWDVDHRRSFEHVAVSARQSSLERNRRLAVACWMGGHVCSMRFWSHTGDTV
jgi:hypothetical protein